MERCSWRVPPMADRRGGRRAVGRGYPSPPEERVGASPLASVPLRLLSLPARPHMALNRGRLRLLELPLGDVLNRVRRDRFASAGGLGFGGRCRRFLVGRCDSRRSLLALLHFGTLPALALLTRWHRAAYFA